MGHPWSLYLDGLHYRNGGIMSQSPVVLGHPQGETPYQQGFKVGKDYWRDQKNPYDSKMWEHNRWEDGFNDGLKERPAEEDPHSYPYWYC
jgi:hypothetical protein